MEDGQALCRENSVKDRHTSSNKEDTDSAVYSEESMDKDIHFSKTHLQSPLLKVNSEVKEEFKCAVYRMENNGDENHSDTARSKEIGRNHFSEDSNDEECTSKRFEDIKFSHKPCTLCLGNVRNAAKYCETCKAFFCVSHLDDHYKSLTSHETVDLKKISSVLPAGESSFQWSNSDPVELPELKVMLLGKTGSGKSASGNTILGREAFKSEVSALPVTKHCHSESGIVEERRITVIDTPGITSEKAAWTSKQKLNEIGPHIFLLVIHLGRFTEKDNIYVKWIQTNFGKEALKFTTVLFTGGDQLKGKSVEEFLDESSELQSLLDSVERRYHVFNNTYLTDQNQTKGLLKTIERTLMSHLGYVYTHEEHEKVKTAVRLEEEKKRERAEKEVNQGKQNKTENEAHVRGSVWRWSIMMSILIPLLMSILYSYSYTEDPVELPEFRVMLLGKPGSGKSASGNTILGREVFKSEASALPVTKHWQSQSGVVEGRNITVIDTPGITSRHAAWLSEKQEPNAGPHVFLLVIQLGRFTEEDNNTVQWIQSNFGKEALKFTIVLFTGGDQLKGTSVEEFLHESYGLKTLVDSTEGRYHVFDNIDQREHQQVKGLLEKIDMLLRKNMGYPYICSLHKEVKTTISEQVGKRLKMERSLQDKEKEEGPEFKKVMKTMGKRREQMMKRTVAVRIANATATLNELRESIKAAAESRLRYLTIMLGMAAVVMFIWTIALVGENEKYALLSLLVASVLCVVGLLQDWVTFLILLSTFLVFILTFMSGITFLIREEKRQSKHITKQKTTLKQGQQPPENISDEAKLCLVPEPPQCHK